ncbi:exopolyphosphatase [Candidatus Fukatsuia symbiotica]|uniref:Exopolyphosphatase n=1 Tax=Candidatus Fukatsuia symbiotica TaxID=1878942 RepID=A0A2U8I591_9GAMM|nr:exopolyphosphatase [Candidatus Fukatsuia symbiotica]AWK14321.1 exopolyphosphatase [Candidatus Fukatsuia symbiotica]MEA9444578.1 exopolyphosphatase [Candidatus Fukatsuia symbiotica]
MPLHSKCIPQEIAAIDLGSNSFHMVIARIVNGALQVLGRLKKRVHLAEGLDNNNLLSQEAMERGLSCLALFAERLQGFSPDNIRVVATHALRQAANADVFLQRAALVIPYPIEIISGHEEALLIFRGVEHTQPEKGRKLVIDIGGGSTELVIGEDFKPLLVESRPMGCVSFAKKFFPDGEINKINFQRAQLATTQKLETLASQYKTQGWQYALGTSGSIKTVTEILLAMGEKDGLITVERLQLLRDQVLQFNHVNTLKLPGLPEDRRSIFIPGLAIISGIFDTLAINTLRFSDSALREGVLYEMEGRFRHQDIRQRTAQSLVDHYNIDRNQARRVMQTSQQLYAQWQMQNSKLVQPHLTPLLKWAAMLHEIGLSINHSAMQRHSAYILQHTNLPGFNQEQQLLLAMLVRFHRKTIKLEELPKFNLFKKKHYLPLIQLLRLSTLLNNQRQATTTPESLQLITHDNHWTLRFPQDYLAQNNLLALDFEREQAYWNNVTDWQLTIE